MSKRKRKPKPTAAAVLALVQQSLVCQKHAADWRLQIASNEAQISALTDMDKHLEELAVLDTEDADTCVR